MAWQPARICVCTAPGTWTRHTRRRRGFPAAPRAENILDRAQHRFRVKVADQDQERVLRRVRLAVDALQVIELKGGNLLLGWSDEGIRMGAEEHFAQAFAGKEARLGA